MAFSRRMGLVLILCCLLCGGAFAQDTINIWFNGDDLNNRISSYINNVSSLVPDLTTFQDVISYNPGAMGNSFWFSAGMNGNIAFFERKQLGGFLEEGQNAFGSDIDLMNFPDGVPFLPAVSIDIKFGYSRFIFGLNGMWLDETILADEFGTPFVGQGSSFGLYSFGVNFGYIILKDSGIIPAVTAMAGYYYTGYDFGISKSYQGKSESVDIHFRNDSYYIGAQVSKSFLLNMLTPYAGAKVIFSKTDSEYSWHTNRPVLINEMPYLEGATYSSAGNVGGVEVYSQVYGGLGVLFMFNYLLTVGGAYTVGTNHFTVNFSFRFIL